jgi:very-short-patch-repair endonuclease
LPIIWRKLLSLSTFEIDAALSHLGQTQLGLVTTAGAAACGVDHRALVRRRSTGALLPIFTGVMRLSAALPSPDQRILAASLAVAGSAVAATSAAAVHRMPVIAAAGESPPVVIATEARSARTAGVRVIRTAHVLPSQPWYTTRVTTPTATLVQLPRFVDAANVERCLDYCLAHRLVSVHSVQELVGRLPARVVPGRGMLLELLAERSSGIGHRSRLEQIVRGWLNDAGLGGWHRNYRVPVGGGRSVEVDFGWPSHMVALEVSPFFTHGSRPQQERDAERRRTLVASGWRIVEATDPDLDHQRAFATVVESLRHLMSRALSPAERAESHRTLAS